MSNDIGQAPDRDLAPPRSPGLSNRRTRQKTALARFEAIVQQEDPNLPEDEVTERAEKLLAEYVRLHPKAKTRWVELAPVLTARHRSRLDSDLEVAAMRRTDIGRELNALLRAGNMGRPTERKLPTSVLERILYSNEPAEVMHVFKEFCKANEMDEFVYESATGERRDTKTLGGTYAAIHAMLKRNDPEIIVGLNVRAIKKLRQRHPEIGINCVIDGTDIVAPVQQRKGATEEEARIIDRGRGTGFMHHELKGGKTKSWRGWTLLVIADIASTLPIAWTLIPNEPYHADVETLLKRLYSIWPDCPMQTLTGDSQFDVESICEMLLFGYGVKPIFVRHGSIGSQHPWHKTDGTPYCEIHGEHYTRMHAENFYDPDRRAQEGLKPGEYPANTDAKSLWECKHCQRENRGSKRVWTYAKHNPRAYTFHPFQGDHKLRHHRTAHMARRNSVESLFATLKNRKIGLGKSQVPKWLQTRQEAEWLCGGGLLGITLSRSVHLTGEYDAVRDEAEKRGLVARKLKAA